MIELLTVTFLYICVYYLNGFYNRVINIILNINYVFIPVYIISPLQGNYSINTFVLQQISHIQLSRRLNVSCIMFKIIAFPRFYVRVGILLACGKHLHGHFLLKCLFQARKVSGHVFVC